MKPKHLFWVFLFLGVGACTEPPPPSLNSKDREIIDSLYKLQVKDLKDEADSICDSQHDSLLRVFIDSMMTLRKQEIERQLQRIRQLEQ
ncbi:MAG: hypothetical protein AAGH79_08265 [Bacteroidota bacterium]